MIVKGGGESPRGRPAGGVEGRGRPTPAQLARGVEGLGRAAELAARFLGADRATSAQVGRGMREWLAAEVAAELADRDRRDRRRAADRARHARGGAPDPR